MSGAPGVSPYNGWHHFFFFDPTSLHNAEPLGRVLPQHHRNSAGEYLENSVHTTNYRFVRSFPTQQNTNLLITAVSLLFQTEYKRGVLICSSRTTTADRNMPTRTKVERFRCPFLASKKPRTLTRSAPGALSLFGRYISEGKLVVVCLLARRACMQASEQMSNTAGIADKKG